MCAVLQTRRFEFKLDQNKNLLFDRLSMKWSNPSRISCHEYSSLYKLREAVVLDIYTIGLLHLQAQLNQLINGPRIAVHQAGGNQCTIPRVSSSETDTDTSIYSVYSESKKILVNQRRRIFHVSLWKKNVFY